MALRKLARFAIVMPDKTRNPNAYGWATIAGLELVVIIILIAFLVMP